MTVVRRHQQAFDERQENARAKLEAGGVTVVDGSVPTAPAPNSADQPKPRADH